jgi:hypothetical protein
MKARGYRASDAGRVLYDAVLARAGEPAPEIPPSDRLSREAVTERRQRRAARSQQRHYSDDYVYEYVEGGGTAFDFGYDFHECATLKLCRVHGSAEFTPFYCFLDYPKAELGGLGLLRTMTLAEGYELCDHRFREGGQATQSWPPSFLGQDDRAAVPGQGRCQLSCLFPDGVAY